MTAAVRWPSAFALSLALHATGIALLVAFVRLQAPAKWVPSVEVSLVQPITVGEKTPNPVVASAPPQIKKAALQPAVSTEISAPAEVAAVESESVPGAVETGVALPRGGGEAMDLETRFLSEFRNSVHRRKYYPPQAKRQRAEGRVMVDVILRKDGGYESLAVAESSASGVLDQAALEILRRVEGRHPIPDELERSRWALRIPVEFQLDNEE